MSKWIENWTPGEHETYRRKVVDLAAFRFGYENEPEWFRRAIAEGWVVDKEVKLELKNGDHLQFAWKGDWILLRKGYCIGIHHDEFIEQYEPTPKFAKLIP